MKKELKETQPVAVVVWINEHDGGYDLRRRFLYSEKEVIAFRYGEDEHVQSSKAILIFPDMTTEDHS